MTSSHEPTEITDQFDRLRLDSDLPCLVIVTGPGVSGEVSFSLGLSHSLADSEVFDKHCLGYINPDLLGSEKNMFYRSEIMQILRKRGTAIYRGPPSIFMSFGKARRLLIEEMENILGTAIRVVVFLVGTAPEQGQLEEILPGEIIDYQLFREAVVSSRSQSPERQSPKKLIDNLLSHDVHINAILDYTLPRGGSAYRVPVDWIDDTPSRKGAILTQAASNVKGPSIVPRTLYRPRQVRVLVEYLHRKKGKTYHHITVHYGDGWTPEKNEIMELCVGVYPDVVKALWLTFASRGSKPVHYELLALPEIMEGHPTHVTINPGRLKPQFSSVFIEDLRARYGRDWISRPDLLLSDLSHGIMVDGIEFFLSPEMEICRDEEGCPVIDSQTRKPLKTPKVVTTEVRILALFGGDS